MSRFNTNTFRSLNESIARIQNPIAALDEAMEYTAALEEILLALCEELDLDPNELMEDIFDNSRSASVSRENIKIAQKQEKAGQKPKGFAAKVKAKHEEMKKSKTKYGISKADDDADVNYRMKLVGDDPFGPGRPLRGKKGTKQVKLVPKPEA